MKTDLESAKQPLVNNNRNMPKWEKISKIIKEDNDIALQAELDQGSMEMVLKPQDSQHYKTALHAAVEHNAEKCLNILLNANPTKKILDSPDGDGDTPLHIAVNSLNVAAVNKLLESAIHINARNDRGCTALHLLAFRADVASTPDKLTLVLQCTELLLQQSNIDLEAFNNQKQTVLRVAAGKFTGKSNSLEEFCRKLVNRGTVIDPFSQNAFDKHCIAKIVSPPGMQRPIRPVLSKMLDLIILKQTEKISVVFEGKTEEEKRTAANTYIGSKKVLYCLVDQCDQGGVEALLNMGANPWSFNLNGELSLHRALYQCHYPIVNHLINEMKRVKGNRKVDLQWISFSLLQKALKCNKTRNQENRDINPDKCLQRLFENDVVLDVNQLQEGNFRQSALHIAAAVNNQDAMSILLEHGAFIGENKFVDNKDNGTVLKALMPKTLDRAMNNCIKDYSDKDEDGDNDLMNPDYTLEFVYKFLIPRDSDELSKVPQLHNEVATLFAVSQCKEHSNSIKHPLIQTFLYAKWRKVFPLYLFNLILYFIFVVLLTAFMYALKNLRVLEELERIGNTTDITTLHDQIRTHQALRAGLMAIVLLITVYMVCKEVFQIIFTYKTYYLYIENYLEWFLVLTVLIACLVPLSVDCTRHLAAWAMIVAWYEFVLVLGRAPPLAIYITMLRHVSWNFLKVIFLFGFLILAFSLSFNIISSDESAMSDFTAFWTTVPRAIVMSTGEFEYSAISEKMSKEPLYAISTVLIFLVFLFLIFLVLMNVMTGLAVTDAKEIVEDAILYTLKSRLELVYLNEQLFLKTRCLRRFLPRLQLLNTKNRRLLVKLNKYPKTERILYGEDGDTCTCKLDDTTATIIRTHRLQQMANMKAASEVDPTERILQLLEEMRQ